VGAGAAVATILAAAPMACKTPDATTGLRDANDPNQPAVPSGGVYPGPSGALSESDNFQLWSKYCTGTQNVADPVDPNYADSDVMEAAKVLSAVNRESFYLYRDVLFFHKTPVPAAASSAGITSDAHNFLSYLCGEFRDRAPMVRTKIEWARSISYLAKGNATDVSCRDRNRPLATGNEPTVAWQPYESPWQQMCIEDYSSYLNFSREFFETKNRQILTAALELEDGTSVSGKLKIGNIATIDRYVPATTICETKYIFAEYLKKGRRFREMNDTGDQALQKYSAGYKVFAQGCSQEDRDYYYDFRGDSNYKPNSPEGNGMIWFAKSAALQCQSRTKAKPGMTFKDEDCERYFKYPFRMRFSAARAGLASWLLQSEADENAMKGNSSTYYTIVQNFVGDQNYMFGDKGPYIFRVNDSFSGKKINSTGTQGTFLPGHEAAWLKKDMGLTTLSGKTGEELKELVYRRIRNAVDRHTNWYKSSFDSDPKLPSSNRARIQSDQAYSPFVASSYEMSESDNFTGCGPTIPCGNRGPDFTDHKHWMFIFKVHKDKWYKPEDIAAGKLDIDFDTMWFDETAFGDSGLANAERAWDRLGSPIEDEHAEILYLYRIPN
jgi:hypothetical protein